jgi:dTDP-4-amino-4,6-dideoxygalactose transaminase
MKQIKFAQPIITDEEMQEVLKVFASPILTHGPQVEAFEREFAEYLGGGVECVAVSSCWAALHIAMMLLPTNPIDSEILTPAMSHVASAHAVRVVGATPVFVDCELETGNVTAEALEGALRYCDDPVAISLVHFLGTPCELDEIYALAHQDNLAVIEDCAIALGSRYKGSHVGTRGLGCFSFYPAKHMTTGEGGMLACKNPEEAALARQLRGFGVDKTHGERRLPGQYDVRSFGINARMSELQAALGRTQLRHVEGWRKKRQDNWIELWSHLSFGTPMIYPGEQFDNTNPYCLEVLLSSQSQRDAVSLKLKEWGIETSVYYPRAIPDMTYYHEFYGDGAFPHARKIAATGLALPIGPHLMGEDLDYIAEKFMKAVKEVE